MSRNLYPLVVFKAVSLSHSDDNKHFHVFLSYSSALIQHFIPQGVTKTALFFNDKNTTCYVYTTEYIWNFHKPYLCSFLGNDLEGWEKPKASSCYLYYFSINFHYFPKFLEHCSYFFKVIYHMSKPCCIGQVVTPFTTIFQVVTQKTENYLMILAKLNP